jgi:hypothetical protein
MQHLKLMVISMETGAMTSHVTVSEEMQTEMNVDDVFRMIDQIGVDLLNKRISGSRPA